MLNNRSEEIKFKELNREIEYVIEKGIYFMILYNLNSDLVFWDFIIIRLSILYMY